MSERPGPSRKRSPLTSPGSHDDNSGPKEKKAKHSSSKSHPQRITMSSSDIKKLSRAEIIAKWKEQDSYINYLLKKSRSSDEIYKLKESETKLQQQLQDSVKRENILNMKLATKHQEMQDLLTQIHDLKQAQTQSVTNLHSVHLDPAVNLVFQKMKEELRKTKEQLETAQSDLSAWKFTPDSVAGKKLMARCRSLIKENEELGKQLSQGKIAKLEAEIALQKKYSQELTALQNELCEYVLQLDEESEGMHSLVLQLKHKVKELESELRKKRKPNEPETDVSKTTTA